MKRITRSRDGDEAKLCWGRLDTIENILGDDYDLEHLKELVQADREGKCMVLPCKVGQDAWFYASTMKELCKAKIIKIEINFFTPRNPFWLTFEYYSSIIGKHEIFSRADLLLGKTLFLSKEEAEAALERSSHEQQRTHPPRSDGRQTGAGIMYRKRDCVAVPKVF